MITIVGISDARENLPTLIDKVNKSLDRVIITVNGKPKAVVLSSEELESIEETAEILAIPGARESIKRGLAQVQKRQGVPFSKI